MKKLKSNTCIAALADKRGKIYIAADRRVSWDFSQCQTMPTPKVIKRDGVILAGTGDGYLCDILTKLLNIPLNTRELDSLFYLHEIIYPQIIKLLTRKGMFDHHEKALKIPADAYCEVLLVFNHKLFSICIYNPDPNSIKSSGIITIDQLAIPYATGCGGQLAWGSLLTTENLGLNVKERLRVALNVAATVSPGCNNEIDIESE